ncbi:TetR/AcrR family transcriptional regulator [Geomesophilobacter sediminis]|uniref:TetR/AcrR family transcriptional regulator n=1 Tax=Geomesophilobacter sediminis TaxID=2798584 RepID=A0A8J7J7Y0_9BACT|nr:TetR/AcrR family transcriptional regulator [Geomesophilobacter sediminis]MBJ6725546.1 TetR/AcrR family transcriptional regulator [Geomesophilobacter sediminis]
MKLKTEAKRQAIIDTAAQVFRSVGFERSSMAEICARVGGSKATIYNYFSSKEELFTEVMLQSTEAEFEAVLSFIDASAGDLGAMLRNFGERFLDLLYSPEVQAARHLAIAQARHSDIGRLVYERGVLRSQSLIAQFLGESMREGKLRQADPTVATRHLVALLESELLDRFLFQLPGAITPAEISGCTARAVDAFLAAYAPPPLQAPSPSSGG